MIVSSTTCRHSHSESSIWFRLA